MQAAPYGTDPSSGPSPSTVRQRTALVVACVTIGLERFAFYVVVALLLLFLTERHHQSDAQASTWYGILMGATYFTPLFGGMICTGAHGSLARLNGAACVGLPEAWAASVVRTSFARSDA